jgi:UPF0755 protein
LTTFQGEVKTLRLHRLNFYPLQLLLGVLGLAALLVGLTGALVHAVLAPVTARESDPVVVQIPANTSTAQIAAILDEQGLIRNQKAFRLYARLFGLDGKLQAGEYALSPALSTPEVIDHLVHGRTRLISFTVPEGLNLEQTTALLAQRGMGDQQRFNQLLEEIAATHPLGYRLPDGTPSLEGYLFPDTYLVSPGSSERDILLMMLSRFEDELERLNLAAKARQHGLTLHEAVTLASLIEREARVPEERAVISGVLHNRLRLGMLLQVDATVIYALGDYSRQVVLYTDLEVDSPYNTYRYSGLPPGPIASPGRASLLAAVEPEEHDYLYYVAKPDGSHAFSRTLAEHNQKKRLYLP